MKGSDVMGEDIETGEKKETEKEPDKEEKKEKHSPRVPG